MSDGPRRLTRLWHGFADMTRVPGTEVVVRSGEGVWLQAIDGRRYLDATAALWYCNIGYGRVEVAEAVAKQIARLHAYSSFGAYATEPTLELADRLSREAPIEDAVAFFGSGGSDAVETAAKLVRRYWDVVGQPGRRIIVSREGGFHGMHAWGTSLGGIPANAAGYGGPIIEEVITVGANDTETLGALFERDGHRIAAFIGEPVVGAGGVFGPEPQYWPEVMRLCREHDILLIADEVITGFGRVGAPWGSDRYGIQPDVIAFAKGVTSGYLPLGGILVGRRIQEPFWDGPPGTIFRHGYTYSGHAAACVAALTNLDIIEREDLVGRVAGLEREFSEALHRLDGSPLVSTVRTIGLMCGIELAPAAVSAQPSLPGEIVSAALRNGIATRIMAGSALHVSPSLVISTAEIDHLVSGLASALDEVEATTVA